MSEIGDQLQETLDVDYQYHFLVGDEHNVICGAGFRHIDDHLLGTFNVALDPAYRSTDLFSYFVQDEIMLEEDLWYLVMGSKFEHNDFTGFEYQPSVRLLYTPTGTQDLVGRGVAGRADAQPDRSESRWLTGLCRRLARHSSRGWAILARLGGLLAYEFGYRDSTHRRICLGRRSSFTTTTPVSLAWVRSVRRFSIPASRRF